MLRSRHRPTNLTDVKVRALRASPTGGEYTQGDTQVPGFGVRVRPGRAAAYVVMKQRLSDGKLVRITLGRVGTLTLADAREKAREAIAALHRGVDINAEKRHQREIAKNKRRRTKLRPVEGGYAPGTFGDLAMHYIARECARLARGGEAAGTIRRELLPLLGHRPFALLRRRDLAAIAYAIADSGRAATAHKVYELGKRIGNWASEEELIERNPFERGKSPIRLDHRTRELAPVEIKALWQAWQTMGTPMGAFMMFALVTAQRRNELATLERAELDIPARLWTIPAAKAKNRKPHLVPLSSLAIEILSGLPTFDDRYVWSTRPGTHVSGYSKAHARAVELSGVTDWRLHDLRRTAATRLAELGTPLPVVSRLLNHSPRGVMGVTAIYNRYEYLDERRVALERWAERIREITAPSPADIVELSAAAE